MNAISRPTYDDVIAEISADPGEYWLEQARTLIDWVQEPTRAVDASAAPIYRWFPDGELNVCFNALDRHVAAGRGDQAALIYDSPVTDTIRTITYAELLDEVSRFARALSDRGVGKGDRVVIYLPMIPEAAVAMLACARIGAIHSVVFGGFAPAELAVRIEDTAPKAVISTSAGVERGRILEYKPMLDEAIDLAESKPEFTVIVQRDEHRCELGETDLDYAELLAATSEGIEPVTVKSTDELYVLYTSGTTGKPKGIVRDSGGYAVALAYSMPHIFGLEPGDTMFTASDVGWVVGHSYIVYGPLLAGVTSVLFEGKPIGTPDAGTFFRIIEDHGVNVHFTAPTAMRVIRKEDPDGALIGQYDLSSLRASFLAGERLDPDTYEWTTRILAEATGRDIPVVDNWWQTETGWPIAANPLGLTRFPLKAGSPTKPVPGYDIEIVDPGGAPVPAGQEGLIVMKLPLPPGTMATVWGDDSRFVSSYLSAFDGYYLTGDSGYLDEDGYVYVMGRTDDVINVAGHRLSTGVMEAVIASHPAVTEAAVIGVHDETKGQSPRALVVLGDSAEAVDPDEITAELVAMVRKEIGPVAAFRQVDIVSALPKTRSGKILRKTMREIADGAENPAVPSTIEDRSVLDALEDVLRRG
ncbi:acetate--CoA ligase [Brevibacterium casei]|uniref:Propionate--CoA ligase n=1 Tax=Brevibacterium casei TaxID=33889 RepID=A0AB34XSI9_9MICO|nr:acetate--CoA ligase [Brevibacterium casei]SIG86855.1 AMP-dependent synthetase and ligase [Mycobacteroides abscessus subsp. abscessus]KZE21610.1 propionate--CoA ligase [Brevibacterium casei]MCT1445885.1 acetate--CoA ligase [Brevibacterium casei]MCT2181785.1 acetate--CoA ligase [Brevibacterium casei]QZE25581.1 acetate--CoA ligase [Brevibacterium casei]